MSAPHRPFLRRFMLVLLGMLLLLAVVFAGVGWMVARHGVLVAKGIGEKRGWRLWHWYLGIATQFMPGDRDGDGACDGLELFVRTDPLNPGSCPDFGPGLLGHRYIAYCGERLATRWIQEGKYTGRVRWPRGF